jgi:acyl carrier protein
MNTQEALNWISEIFEEPAGRINAAMARAEIPGWDSLGTLSLLAALDERFDIHLSEQEIEGLQSVKDIFELLRRHDALSA